MPAYLSPLANHVWQSTVFAGLAGLLRLAFRKNRALVRYWIWLAASVKFLIPFLLLVSLGGQLGWRTASPVAQPRFSFVMDEISQPFAKPDPGDVVAGAARAWCLRDSQAGVAVAGRHHRAPVASATAGHPRA